MTIKIYVNWDNSEVISEADYEKLKEETKKEPDEIALDDYLTNNYSITEILLTSNEKREEILSAFVDFYLSDNWEMNEIEV